MTRRNLFFFIHINKLIYLRGVDIKILETILKYKRNTSTPLGGIHLQRGTVFFVKIISRSNTVFQRKGLKDTQWGRHSPFILFIQSPS